MSARIIQRRYRPLRQHDWRDRIRPGDVLRFPGDRLRTVIGVTVDQNGFLSTVTLPILRCSWTEAAYTIFDRTMLKERLARPTRARADITRAIPRGILHDCLEPGGRERRYLSCCDVVGIYE